MSIRLLDTVVTCVFLAFGLYVLWSAVGYGITSDNGPGPGTFPLIAGLLITVFSVGVLWRGTKFPEGEGVSIGIAEVAKVAGILAVLGIYILAFDSLGAFLPLPFLILGTSLVIHWRTDPKWMLGLLGLAVAFSVCAYFIFAVFLRVLLPVGPLGF
ncbi:MAG TPA: hypothetical protein DIT93_12785 [Pelagibacterium sp.]|nr:hypothetical protein [Pelagibacterium sp.]|tara:strand:- start:1069 stop:1536 length:468 start_codon:yes stop_codon:yes gene_type:complete